MHGAVHEQDTVRQWLVPLGAASASETSTAALTTVRVRTAAHPRPRRQAQGGLEIWGANEIYWHIGSTASNPPGAPRGSRRALRDHGPHAALQPQTSDPRTPRRVRCRAAQTQTRAPSIWIPGAGAGTSRPHLMVRSGCGCGRAGDAGLGAVRRGGGAGREVLVPWPLLAGVGVASRRRRGGGDVGRRGKACALRREGAGRRETGIAEGEGANAAAGEGDAVVVRAPAFAYKRCAARRRSVSSSFVSPAPSLSPGPVVSCALLPVLTLLSQRLKA